VPKQGGPLGPPIHNERVSLFMNSQGFQTTSSRPASRSTRRTDSRPGRAERADSHGDLPGDLYPGEIQGAGGRQASKNAQNSREAASYGLDPPLAQSARYKRKAQPNQGSQSLRGNESIELERQRLSEIIQLKNRDIDGHYKLGLMHSMFNQYHSLDQLEPNRASNSSMSPGAIAQQYGIPPP